jgi:hypothetical protein
MSDDGSSLLTYAGLGGIVACCLAFELLGGAAILGGVATVLGFSTGLTYLVVVGVASVFTTLLALGYQQYGGASRV